MIVYGVALLAFCMLVGMSAGGVIGSLLGVNANVGGVGIAMLLLIILSSLSADKFKLNAPTESGIHFWNAMYIPIVVAMAAKQNVFAAISSGWLAVIAGTAAVICSLLLIPVLSRLGGPVAALDSDDTQASPGNGGEK